MSFVLDCSAALPWVFADEVTAGTDRLLDELAAGEQALVPASWPLELGNVLLGAMRKKRIDQAGVETFFSRLGDLEILVDVETADRAWDKTLDLAQQHRLSAYDAAYLELAMRRGVPLATLDKELAAACRAAGVKLKLR
ncbi:MAG: type II toxin-antitoxin system VapC family toxin [Chthoniobacterales bacterium]|nr:type II toxin-antitoxin system VapC family toxin [Chthoniobacterales bacterium]